MDTYDNTPPKTWLKPSEIAERGLILNTKGKKDYGYVVRLIKSGKLKAQNRGLGKTPYWIVPLAEINNFNIRGVEKSQAEVEIEKLANYLMYNHPKSIKGGSAVDTAIEIMEGILQKGKE